jgi:hypothetical protein
MPDTIPLLAQSHDGFSGSSKVGQSSDGVGTHLPYVQHFKQSGIPSGVW